MYFFIKNKKNNTLSQNKMTKSIYCLIKIAVGSFHRLRDITVVRLRDSGYIDDYYRLTKKGKVLCNKYIKFLFSSLNKCQILQNFIKMSFFVHLFRYCRFIELYWDKNNSCWRLTKKGKKFFDVDEQIIQCYCCRQCSDYVDIILFLMSSVSKNVSSIFLSCNNEQFRQAAKKKIRR